jgi:uncharacterized membrane protein YhaH (DUF805 family)
MNYYLAVLKNYVGFSGRARRAEFWQFALINLVILIALDVIGLVAKFPLLGGIYALAVLLPGLAVTIRRLHDTDKSGWWYLIVLVPLVGAIVLLVFTATEGTRGPNKYGADPKNLVPPMGSPVDQLV